MQVLGSLPHLLAGILFRVGSTAFLCVYLAFYTAVPVGCLLLANIVIFYRQEADQELRAQTKLLNKRIKLLYRQREKEARYKAVQSNIDPP